MVILLCTIAIVSYVWFLFTPWIGSEDFTVARAQSHTLNPPQIRHLGVGFWAHWLWIQDLEVLWSNTKQLSQPRQSTRSWRKIKVSTGVKLLFWHWIPGCILYSFGTAGKSFYRHLPQMNLYLGLNINLGFKNFKSSAEVTIFSLEYFSRSTIYHDGVFVGGTSSLSTHIVPTTDSPGTFDFDFTLIFLDSLQCNI